jgi:type VI protein secretion system component VasF
MAEFIRRQTEAQLSAAAAQREAAEAAKATAAYTQQSARYILWSVYAIAASAILTAIFSAISLCLRR